MFVVAALPPIVADNLSWFVAAAIVLIGLVGFGMADVGRFAFQRVWAISGVCFAESIRRRVLWITPLAILGVIFFFSGIALVKNTRDKAT